MGLVWKAVDTKLDRQVAIKFLPDTIAENSKQLARFEREAKAVAALNHPNIVTIHSVEEADGAPFITMEFVEGRTLGEMIPPDGMAPERLLDIAIPLADAIGASHEKGVTHRDLKPGNIMVTRDGRTKVLDFGLAKLSRQDSPESLTQEGKIVGTLKYMSPEQVQGTAVDHRTDVFSLGVVLYEAATGRRPFESESMIDIVTSIVEEQPTSASELNPAIPRTLARIIDRCLMKEPRRRFQTVIDLRKALDGLQSELTMTLGTPARTTELQSFASGEVDRHSVAVLPFQNLSADPDNEYFSDGITDELIGALGQVQGLRVVSRTSAFAFKGKAEDIRTIGDRLGVGTVLEGSVRRSEERVRISAQLTNVSDGYNLWSRVFDREMKDLFDIQAEIAHTIVDTLKVTLTSDDLFPLIKRSTTNLDAYHLYLKGRFFWNQQTTEGFQQAIRYFNQALAEDPDYALAHSGVADYYGMLGFWGLTRPAEVWPKAREAASKALAIDSALAEAHVSLGWVRLFYEWDSAGGEAEFRQAIELNPGSANAHFAHSLFLTQMGRFDDAFLEVERARNLDPLSPMMNAMVAWVQYYARRYDEAIVECKKTLELQAGLLDAHIVLGQSYREQKRFDAAIEELEQARELSHRNPLILGVLGSALAVAGRQAEAREILGELIAMSEDADAYVAPLGLAALSCGLGERDEVFYWLDLALDAHDGLVRYLKVYPVFDALRDDPRFAVLLRRVGLGD